MEEARLVRFSPGPMDGERWLEDARKAAADAMRDECIPPTMEDRDVVPKVAVATARTAIAEGVTNLDIPEDDLVA